MARKTKGRPVHGILLLDKPGGISSNAALQRVKRLYQAQKAGHTGSLDNLATGLLPICLGEATKLSGYLLDADKQYQAQCKLGETTDTADAEGQILQTRPVTVSRADIEQLLPQFLGEQEQVPPMYSALKHQGQPLYKLARAGKTIERKARRIRIDAIELLDFDGTFLKLDVSCTKGTYIRTLAEDIGEALGCGAHITALRRTRVGQLNELISLEQLGALTGADNKTAEEQREEQREEQLAALDALLRPMDLAVANWPELHLSAAETVKILHGQRIQRATKPNLQGEIKLISAEQVFIGLGEVNQEGEIIPRRLFCF
ncbi:tRNA pseudouridine(55) synthase TruB [Candidatus Venteria ishoeyi]|uniref:tRNA pseudouridine synthase B n=1 Tax=Candidatus Venteria ishoeyi TaxID=1899563 RepID=A0A1H6F6J8_9GAMM|nr:tRNA pseudouridine(55) synthase TruB [Candidatus Venteria ishoeyi]MDM8548350.1 tRNA pseudouridine(55) synthase TruB [Candidatus Venteria ishoeyi]SEH04624.1 tRNA pseudouridine synthase B [Candidatus Venteria ishoeyi]